MPKQKLEANALKSNLTEKDPFISSEEIHDDDDKTKTINADK